MLDNIKEILKKLEIDKKGRYDNHFYVITLDDSNEYARMYTKLDTNAINTGYPEITTNSNNSTTKIINYFEIEVDNITYNIFLFADFDNNSYYLKIGEKD